jgi:hypothetical protein
VSFGKMPKLRKGVDDGHGVQFRVAGVFRILSELAIWVYDFGMKMIFGILLFVPVLAFAEYEALTIDDKIEIGYGLAIGDVDGDKKADILLADKSQVVWYRNGDWKRFVMAENLNPRDGLVLRDNVCLAARDIDGDGKVEVAVGAQWNPGETTDAAKSGSVHFLMRPEDPTKMWQPVRLHHEPTVHRMHWVKTGDAEFKLLVLPLHGRGNKNGAGAGVKFLAYDVPEILVDAEGWKTTVVDESMHITHNFDVLADETVLLGGKEGVKRIRYVNGAWKADAAFTETSAGEVRETGKVVAAISPLHGNVVVVFDTDGKAEVIDESLVEGHALAVDGERIFAGWRGGKFGIRCYET